MGVGCQAWGSPCLKSLPAAAAGTSAGPPAQAWSNQFFLQWPSHATLCVQHEGLFTVCSQCPLAADISKRKQPAHSTRLPGAGCPPSAVRRLLNR